MTRTCKQCGEKFEKEDVPKEYLYNNNLCSRGCNKKNQREYYEEKKNSGKCPMCGEPALEDSVCCQECLEKEKERYERNKREGKCPMCGEPVLEDSVCCQECLEKENQRVKEKYERYKREGKCPKCGEPAPEDSVRCQECLEKKKEKYEIYKREGKCPKCGDELPADGRNWDGVYCPECQEKYRNDEFYGEFATREELLYGKGEG